MLVVFCADFAKRHQQYQTIVRQQLQITAQPFVMWLAMLYPLFLGSFWDEKAFYTPQGTARVDGKRGSRRKIISGKSVANVKN